MPQNGRAIIETGTDQIIIRAGTADDTTNGLNESINEIIDVDLADEQEGYGFGFFSAHYSHNCDRIGSFSLNNCVYTKVSLLPHNLCVDPNGGIWRESEEVTVIEGIEGDIQTIELPDRPGYTFVGWKREGTNGIMTSITETATYTFGEEQDEDKLIAQWIKIEATKQSDVTTNDVVEGQEITYTITAINTGTVDGKALIKDAPPEGTTFVKKSIKVNGKETNNTQQDLENGITIPVPKPSEGQEAGSSTLSFKVKVKKLTNDTLIENIAQYKDITISTSTTEEPTNEIVVKYIEPIIKAQKTSKTQYNKKYVMSGEEITYSIIVKNEGSLAKKVVINDKIPKGTTFVKNSIKVDGKTSKEKIYSEKDLEKGIEVLVPAKKDIVEDEEKKENVTEENIEKEEKAETKENIEKEEKAETKENVEKEEKAETKENVEKEETKENIEKEEKETTEEGTEKEDEETKKEDKKYNPGQTILTFKVVVNKVEKDTDTVQIVNKAKVDGEYTNEVKHQVLPFNMKIEENIKEVLINGENQNVVDSKMMKTEVHAKAINTTSIAIKYNIVVTNTGKVEGTATVQDSIPEGYKISDSNPKYWKNSKERTIQTTTDVLKPGESKTLEVVLEWQNDQNNFGEKTNKAEIIETKNESNAPETTLKDNESKANMIISIRTGKSNNSYKIAVTSVISGLILVIGIIAIKKKVLE